jgi:DNA primase large subunit
MPSLQDLRFYAKYPFTKDAREYLDSLKLNFENVDVDLLDDASNRITSMSREGELLKEIDSGQEHFLQKWIISYPLSKVLATLSKNMLIKKQFARSQARLVNFFLNFENEETIAKIGKQLFDIKEKDNKYIVPFYQYLNHSPQGKIYKLVNQELRDGFIAVDKNTLSLMIAEYVFNSIAKTEVDAKNVPKLLLYYADELNKHKKYKEYTFSTAELGAADATCFPPCMKKVYAELQAGHPVSHNPRFVIATFFANVNMSIDQAINAFKNQPNFNEKRTRYHLEHAYGTKGQRIKYTTPSCIKLEAYGVCCRDDTCKWKHPLAYYKAKKRVKQPRLQEKKVKK